MKTRFQSSEVNLYLDFLEINMRNTLRNDIGIFIEW